MRNTNYRSFYWHYIMKRISTASKQVIKPILYILLYLVILILLMNSLTRTVSAEKGEYDPVEKEINTNKNEITFLYKNSKDYPFQS